MSKIFKLGRWDQDITAAAVAERAASVAVGGRQNFSEDWRAGVNGKWNDAKRWMPNEVPNALDNVTISAAGSYTVTVDTAAYAQSVALDDAAATLLIATGGNLAVDSGFAVTAGTLALTDRAAMSVYGTLSIAAGSEILATGRTSISAYLVNAGLIDITSDRLVLSGGGSIGGSVTGQGAIDFAGGSFTSSIAALTANGLQIENGSTLTLEGASGALTASEIKVGSGALVAPSGAQITVDSDLSFGSERRSVSAAGTLSGSFLTTGTTTINETSGISLDLAQVNWSNSGTVNVNGAIDIGSNSDTIINQTGGLFLLNGGGGTEYGPSSGALFTNAGTLAQTAPGAYCALAIPIDNTGLIELSGGGLVLSGGGTIAGSVAGAGVLVFAGTYTTTLKALGGDAGLTLVVNQGELDLTGHSGTLDCTVGQASYDAFVSVAKGMDVSIAGANVLYGAGFGGTGTLTTTGSTNSFSATFYGGLAWVNTGVINNSTTIYSYGATQFINGAGAAMNFAGGGVNATGSSFTNDLGGTISLDGSTISNRTFDNIGTLVCVADAFGGSSLFGTIVNTGTISVDSATLSFASNGGKNPTFTNNGSVQANSATILLSENLTGTGTIDIGSGGSLYVYDAVGSGQTVDFSSTIGSLNLYEPLQFLGDISGFGGGVVIDLINTGETGYNFANGTLTVMNGGTTAANLVFNGNYTTSDFALSPDGNNGTIIKYV